MFQDVKTQNQMSENSRTSGFLNISKCIMPIGTDPKLSNIWPYPLMGKTTIQPRTSPKQRSLLLFLFAPPKSREPRLHEIGYSNKVLELIEHMYSVDHAE